MLIKPPFYFANAVDNIAGTVATAPGTTVALGANSADGSVVEVLSALAFDAHYLVIGFSNTNSVGANRQALMDILVDPAGGTSWASLIDDLVCGQCIAVAAGSQGMTLWYHFPLFVRAGSSIGARGRNAHTSGVNAQCVIYAMGEPSRPDAWWCGQKVESLGIDAASSKGTTVTPGDSSTFGSWTNIGGPAAARYGAIQFGVNGSDADMLQVAYNWEIGYGAARLPGSPRFWVSADTAERAVKVGFGQPIFCDIAEGTQLQARAACSGTAEDWNAALYGVH